MNPLFDAAPSDPAHGNSGPGGWLPPGPKSATCLVCSWTAQGDDRLDAAREHGKATGHPTVSGREDGGLDQFIPSKPWPMNEPGS
jgi:hypothetical protein